MPTTADGIRPDIIVNPHAMPSRMTIGHLVETITSKTAAIYGGFGNCTAFTQQGPKHELFGKSLVDAGFHSTGNEILYNGMTGEQLETEIYFGPTYYLRLKHMPKDKINYRATGPRTLLTRQTVQGRANNGGLRVGEMDRDCIIAHGLNYFLNESMMVRGDEFYMAICNHSGTIAIYNERNNLFISPFVDGPVKFVTDINSDISIKNVSKFGKDFSVVRVPYAFKLLMQELQAMNIQMRIITEDNVDMLTSLKESDNIVRLTKFNDLEEIAKENKNNILKNKKMKNISIMETEPSPPIQTNLNMFQPSDLEAQGMEGDLGFNYKLQPGDPGYVFPTADMMSLGEQPDEKDPWADDWSPEERKTQSQYNTPPKGAYLTTSPDWDPNDPDAQPSDFIPKSPEYNPNIYTTTSPDWDPNDPNAQPRFSISTDKSEDSPAYNPKNYQTRGADLKRREPIYDDDEVPEYIMNAPSPSLDIKDDEDDDGDAKKEKITIINGSEVGNEDLEILSAPSLSEADKNEGQNSDDEDSGGKKGIKVDL